MMLRIIGLWSRFIIWLFDGFKGVAALKDAWFIGSPRFYFGVPVWVGAIPVSGAGWMLFLGLGAYLFALFFLLPMFAYVPLALLGIGEFYRLVPARTYWTTREKLRELYGR
ncbi:MAG: hypothetical protein ACLPPF_14170 [Rhodomicrobium sp.]